MTENKARKRAVRARISKTGERYTAARRHIVNPNDPAPLVDLGPSDDSVRHRTGRGWTEWLRILDAWGATKRSHRDIARYLSDEHGVGGWWAQSVTVGYERARGMRAPYQTAEGFQVGVSKTLPVDVGTLFQAFADPSRRSRWLERGTLRVRTAQEGKSVRFDFGNGSSRVIVGFTAKGPAKARVAIQHERLPHAGAVEEMRAFWKEHLARLAEMLPS